MKAGFKKCGASGRTFPKTPAILPPPLLTMERVSAAARLTLSVFTSYAVGAAARALVAYIQSLLSSFFSSQGFIPQRKVPRSCVIQNKTRTRGGWLPLV